MSNEMRAKLSAAHIGQKAWNAGRHLSEKHKENLRKSHIGLPSNRSGSKHLPESIVKMSIRKLGKKTTDETKRRMSAAQKEKWRSPDHAAKMIASWRLKPNKKEIKLSAILASMYPGEWKFVGDGKVIIAGKCPDFVNINGQKKIIELFGDYWHQGEDTKVREDLFTPFGFQTLVIWERELKHADSLADKIRRFHDQ